MKNEITTNNLQIFENAEFGQIRTIEINNEIWFIGKDIAEALGYAKSENAIAMYVDKEDKTSTLIQGTGSNYKSKAICINESGLYSLTFSSKLPNAKKFKRWVTSEILPSIRKHGVYATEELIANPDLAIAAFKALKEEREKNKLLKQTTAIQQQQISELQPKASYYDLILQSTSVMSISKIAKDYGKSSIWLNKKLEEKKVQFKQGGIWLLYQKYAKNGYTQSVSYIIDNKRTSLLTKWTQKGRLFIYDLLKADGILPLIEQN